MSKPLLNLSTQKDTICLDNILAIKDDSLLIAKFIEFKNNELIKEHGDLKWQSVYDGNITYSSDSTFRVLNMFGEYTGGATYNPYAENFILKNKNIIHSKIDGNITKIERDIITNDYIVTSNYFSRMGSNIQVYKTRFIEDSLRIIKTLPDTDHE